MALTSFVAEFWWVEVVFNRFPLLREDRRRRTKPQEGDPLQSKGVAEWFKREIRDWTEFSRLPIFASKARRFVLAFKLIIQALWLWEPSTSLLFRMTGLLSPTSRRYEDGTMPLSLECG